MIVPVNCNNIWAQAAWVDRLRASRFTFDSRRLSIEFPTEKCKAEKLWFHPIAPPPFLSLFLGVPET